MTESANSSGDPPAPPFRPRAREYALVGAVLAAAGWYVAWSAARAGAADPRQLIRAMCVMFALTAVVWLIMALVRNGAILAGKASVRYFHDYATDRPREWVERPGRTFNNLMEAPTLFYVVGVLLLVAGPLEAPQVALAWGYVGMRVVHAIVYMVLNYVPLRFATYAGSCVLLAAMWWRFAAQAF